MFHRLLAIFATVFLFSVPALAAPAQELPAFPGAEGFGRYAVGGRGGDVYHVTTLADDGPGSLRQGIMTAAAPRTIVFDVGGTIVLQKQLRITKKANLTVAGQTAPGKGITLRDWPIIIGESHDIVIRYLRVRLGDQGKTKGGEDCMTVNRNQNLILDHLSLSWGVDGNSDYRGNSNMTLQWLIYSEALHHSVHEKGAHAMCTSIRDCKGNTSVHHNIYATSRNRHPTLGGGSAKSNPDALIDFRNCVDYNWTGPTNFGGMKINVIANYYRPGPLSNKASLPMQMKDANLDKARGFMAGNCFEEMPALLNQDNFAAVLYTNSDPYVSTTRQHWQAAQEFPVGDCAIPTQTAQDAYETCLRYSGCSLTRDLPDERLIADIRARQGHLIDSQKDVGGWDPYAEEHRPANWDTDGDGIPDAWELAHGLDPHNPSDGNAPSKSGYTNLEEYLNSLAPPLPLGDKGDASPIGLDAAKRDVAAFKARLPKLTANELIAAFIPSVGIMQYGGYNYYYNYMVNNAIQVELASRGDDIIEVLRAHAHDATRIWEAVNGSGLTVGAICRAELRKRHR